MRVVILGGTEFIGRRITEDLVTRGDDVTVVHRGTTEPRDWVDCRHLHADRRDFEGVSAQVRALRPDAVIDTCAGSAADAAAVLPHLPDARLVVAAGAPPAHSRPACPPMDGQGWWRTASAGGGGLALVTASSPLLP
jgi:NAD(P)-dependent dehydrogenase (short-subunit alcohol dehydrogenase family)